ncbi:WD40 repeat domain-containing serine/threonine protein kinase [Parafrankia sp. FMc2]|uniref:WD40 repeat domain-containing serine/threonine protein kinase n=1 Tax=Parafrankia sp. FMc2 TaxID=3233196 RepID=UPI0034D5865F
MFIDPERVAAALPAYDLGPEVGSGAFGFVLEGRHRGLDRVVAIKVMPTRRRHHALDSSVEARILARFDHPHIIRVHDYVQTDDLHLIVMEMMAGGTLDDRKGVLTQLDACAVGLAVADALTCAHSKGILHRDIKPENMLFDTTGLVKVADFGIAKLMSGAAGPTSTLVGTRHFMPPEQLRGGPLSAATDVYALSVVLHLLLTGEVPPGPIPPRPLLASDGREHPVPPALRAVPGPIRAVIQAALAEDPADRPQTARGFAIALAGAAAAAYGPGWLARADVPVHLHEDVRVATTTSTTPASLAGEQPPAVAGAVLPSAARGDAPARGRAPGPASSASASAPASASASPAAAGDGARAGDGNSGAVSGKSRSSDGGGQRRHARPRSHRTPPPRRLLTASLALLFIAVVAGGTVLAVALSHDQPRVLAAPLGEPLTEHTDWVVSLAFAPSPLPPTPSPARRILASGSKDGTARLWDVSDPAAPYPIGPPLPGTSPGVTSVAFSPDGRTLASGNWDGTVRLWDVTDPRAPFSLGAPLSVDVGGPRYPETLVSVVFLGDGSALASAGPTQTTLWNVTDRQRPTPLGPPIPGRTRLARLVGADVGGAVLGRVGEGSTVRLWSVADPTRPEPLSVLSSGHVGDVNALALSPDQRTMVTGGADTDLRVWDVTDRRHPRLLGKPLRRHQSTLWTALFLPGGRTVVTASYDGTVGVWDVRDREHARYVGPIRTRHTDWLLSMALSPDGRILATGGKDGTIQLWNAAGLTDTTPPENR